MIAAPRRWLAVLALTTALLAGCSAEQPQTSLASPPPAFTPVPEVTGTRPPIRETAPGAVPWGTPPPVVRHGPRDRKMVALTFDADLSRGMLAKLQSGRVASYANMAVIDVLQRHRALATIFFTGMERYPRETGRIVRDPRFELATHSYSHRGFRPGCYRLGYVPPDEMLGEVTRTIEILRRHSLRATGTDRVTRYFRFPGGCYDQTALRRLAPAGITAVEFDVISGDAFGTSADAIVRQTLSRVRNGSIVVLHLTGGDTAPYTDEALPRIITGLRAEGFELVTVSRLLAPAP